MWGIGESVIWRLLLRWVGSSFEECDVSAIVFRYACHFFTTSDTCVTFTNSPASVTLLLTKDMM